MEIENPDECVADLRENGITIVEGFLDDDTTQDLYDRITTSLYSHEFASGDDYGGYSDMASAGEPVANVRTGMDDGMIDIFNLDLVVNDIEEIKNDPQIKTIIDEATGGAWTPTNINTYIRRSVDNPTWFHADSYSKFKTFVYLTDVPDASYGPFSYLEGSHDVSAAEKFATVFLNRLNGQTGAPHAIVPDPKEATLATAPKGTLIIANQAGYHRGHAQKEGRERVLLTTSYTPEDKGRDYVASLATKTARILG